jgi:glycosyltransferase involved in cell wall biosynthesis
MEVVYNPVAPVRRLTQVERLAVRAEANTRAEAVVIIQACRMEPGKGHHVCLDALALLRELPNNWECWQVGGPQDSDRRALFDSLRAQAERLRIADRVRFWGWRTDVPRLLAAADIYCQPNDTFLEGLPNVFVEAMHAGLPVVTTTRIGAVREVVDDTCGILVAPGDARALAAALKSLIIEPGLRTKLANGGPPRANTQFSPAIQIPRLCEVLKKVIPQDRNVPHASLQTN